METRAEAKEKLLAMKEGSSVAIAIAHDGGGEVYRLPDDIYVLYEIPLYGGEPRYAETYRGYHELEILINTAFSWT